MGEVVDVPCSCILSDFFKGSKITNNNVGNTRAGKHRQGEIEGKDVVL